MFRNVEVKIPPKITIFHFLRSTAVEFHLQLSASSFFCEWTGVDRRRVRRSESVSRTFRDCDVRCRSIILFLLPEIFLSSV
jgi:hypothetical protein